MQFLVEHLNVHLLGVEMQNAAVPAEGKYTLHQPPGRQLAMLWMV